MKQSHCSIVPKITARLVPEITAVHFPKITALYVPVYNLHRQILYTEKDIGKPKPLAAKEKLVQLNSEVNYNTYFMRLNKESALEIIPEYDIVADCTDNFSSRYLINDASVILNKPIVYGAILRFSGQLMVLNYHNGPTLRCLYPDPPHPLEVPSCAETGIIGSVAGIIGSMQATEVIKIILQIDGVLSGKIFTIDTLDMASQIISFERIPENSNLNKLGDYDDFCLDENDSIAEISADEVKKMIKENNEITIIDLRAEDERSDIGFDCISVPYYEISKNIHLLLNKEIIIFYCSYGIHTKNVINYLMKVHKIKNLYSLVLHRP